MSLFKISIIAGALIACQPDQPTSETMTLSIQQVKQQHAQQWLAKPKVVSVGIGLNQQKQTAIIINVEELTDALTADLPTSMEGYPIEIQVTGKIKAQ